MKFTICQESRVGQRRNNQDRIAHCYSRDALFMVVADGMGGHLQGEVAAEIAVTEITRLFQQEARNRLRRPSDFLVSVINSAHRAIVSHAVAENLLESPRTTCVACIVQGGTATWAHAGDSRLYVLREGRLVAATQDHSRVQQMVDAGTLTPEAAARHPDRNKVYSCLGGVVPPMVAVGREFPLQAGDTIVLSTDGFWAQVPPALIAAQLRKQDIVSLMPELLSEAHRRARGESDNLSVVAMTWERQDDARASDALRTGDGDFRGSADTVQLGGETPAEDVSEADIEKAIAEIQNAIRKVPR